jgi:hypothetical protein
MARGGKRPGAGRRAGQANKLTQKQRRTLTDIARTHTEEAVKTLVSVMKDKAAPHAAKVSASNSLLDRAWGKPSQSVHHSGSVGTYDLTKLSDDELDRLESILGPLAFDGGDQGGEGEAGGSA